MSYDPATYVEEIPVKISEKYRPPRKVTLSTVCNYQVNSVLLTSEYDLTREYEMLKWIQNLKTYKDEKVKLRKEKIKHYEEEKEEKRRILQEKLEQKQKEEEEEKRKIEENKLNEEAEHSDEEAINSDGEICDKELEECSKNASDSEDLSTQPQNSDLVTDVEENNSLQADQSINKPRHDPLDSNPHVYNPNMPTAAVSQTGIAKSNNSQSIAPQVNVHNITYPPMLIPTQCSPQSSQQKSPIKMRYNINLADFEGDATDPFDSVSLKSINDMEELAKVLQNSNIKQKPDSQNISFPQSGTYMNGGYSYNPYSYMNYTDTNLPPNNPHFNQISSYQSKSSSSSAPTVPLAGKSSSPFQNESFLVDKQYPQWNQIGSNNTNIALSKSSQYKPFNYLVPHSVMSSSSNANASLSETNVVSRSLNNGSFQVPNSGIADLAVSKRPDLEDFYTRYYTNTKKPLSGARSGENTPVNHQISKASLPSSNSVPDLTASEDNEVSKIISNNKFENAVSPYKNMPSRPYSTSGYEVHYNKIQGHTTSSTTSTNVNKRKLPDPFTQLTEEAQTVVQNMAEMGFPRDRVARAVQKLGTEHKNLPEVLLTLQSFQENGEDAYLSERAFYYYMGDVSKVNEFLAAAKTFLDLGFEEERVIEKLFKHLNDKEKCLEELIAPEED